MKNFTGLICLVILAGHFTFAHDLTVPLETLRQFAGSRASAIWGDVYADDPIPLYSLQDELIAYSVNYSIGKPFPLKEMLLELCDQEGRGDGNADRWLTGQYGSMLVSATKATAPLVRFSQVISDEYAYGREIENLAREKFSGRDCELYRIYLMNELAKWYCYKSGDEKVYVKVFPPVEVYTEAEFRSAVQTTYNKDGLWRLPPDLLNGWADYFQGVPFGPLVDHLIPNEAAYVPFYDWSFGCTPTAFSMALAYWDNSGMTSSNDYGNLVKYHLQRYDNVQGDTDKNVPDLQRALAIAMSTDSMTGNTNSCCWLSGFINETNARGYSFSGSDLYGTSAQYLAWAQTEINAGRPFHFGTPGHSSTGVGYDDANYIIRHNTWGPAHDKVIYTQCDLVGTIVPGGQYGAAVNITRPFGDPRYTDDATGANQGEDLYAGDAFEITWNYDYLASSWVRLYYSVNAGTPWTLITSNTPNDGSYDWRIPSGIGSNTLGRVKVEVLDASGVEASDGSYGNFEFHAGGSLPTLSEDSYTTTSTVPDYYQFTNTYNWWSVVGIRPSTGNDWDIALYDDTYFSNVLSTSAWGSTDVDFIVIDGNHTASAARGVKASRYSGTGDGGVEWEGGADGAIAVGAPVTADWTAGDVVEMYDVYLEPGYYKCTMVMNSGTADLGMAFFSNPGSSAYYASRSAATVIADSYGAGASESFWVTITADPDDYYGLCIFANNTNAANITIKFETKGQWLGIVSNDWFDPNNWSAAFVPDATVDVTISTGYIYYPIIASGTGYCNNISIGSGARLSVGNADLDVAGNMTIYGQVEQTHYNADFYVTGNVYWESGSTANITDNGEFHVSGDWEFRSGANVNLANGYVYIEGSSSYSYIRSYDKDCSFRNLLMNKTSGQVWYSSSSTDTLNIDGYLCIYSGNTFYSNTYSPLVLKGQFYNYGHFVGAYGTFIFDGTSHTCDLNTGDYFNNLVISSSGNVTLSDSLRIYGNLDINSGALVTANYPVFIKGGWTNLVGTGGFDEGTGKVVFNGGNYHQYCSNETFYTLEVDKPLGGAFRTSNNAVTCSHYDWTAGAVDVAAGTFTANNLVDNGLYGSYYVNTGGTINLHNADGYIDLHGYLYVYGGTLNVWGGYGWDSFWPYFDNGGVTMTDGVIDIKDYGVLLYNGGYTFTENITGGTIRVATNFLVERADFTPDGGSIEFVSTADCYFHAINGGYVRNVIINKGAAKGEGPALTEKIIRNRETGEVSYAPMSSTVIMDNSADINGNVIIQSGVLSAGSNTMYVEGNWTNSVGTGGFNEGTGTVEFNGAYGADILTTETFYNLDLNKTYVGVQALELWQDVAVTNDLHIIDGTLELNSPADLAITGNLTIDLNACLNADDSYGPQIQVGKNWFNSNTTSTSTAGFYPGSYSRVIFNGITDQYLTTDCPSEAFNFLTVDKTAGKFRPNDNVLCYDDMQITRGQWEDNVSGTLHHTFYGDFTVLASGGFLNAYPLNTVEFTGASNSILTYSSLTGYFYNLLINKTTGYGVTQVGNTSCQFGGNLTVENGTYGLNGYVLTVFGDLNVNDAGTLALSAASTLMLADAKSLIINSGGRLDIDGTSGSPASITANVTTARYNFYVTSGGTIAADYCLFKNMSTYGIYVFSGGIVDPAHAFRGCTFQDGSLVLLLIDNDQLLTIRNAVFPANTWGGSYNVAKTVGSGHLYFVDFTGDFSGEDYDYDPYNLVDWVPTLTATATASPGSICSGSSSQLNVNRSGGLSPFTYAWSPTTGLSNPNIINPLATPVSSTTYSVTVTDVLGTKTSSSIGVTVLPYQTVGVSIAASANPSPPGNWVTFTATPQNGGTTPSYQWKKNDLPVGTGLSTYSDNTLGYGDRVYCVMTSNYQCPLGNPATSNTITMIIVETDVTITGTIPSGTICMDASHTITVAGPAGPFHIVSGAKANMIAGYNIRYLYGTDVDPGGMMHGWITTTNEYCGSLPKSMVSTVGGVETDEVAAYFNGSASQKFMLYPNPTNGAFTLMKKEGDPTEKVTVALFDMRGSGIFSTSYAGERSHQFILNGLAPGLYFLKVSADNHLESFKLIVTR